MSGAPGPRVCFARNRTVAAKRPWTGRTNKSKSSALMRSRPAPRSRRDQRKVKVKSERLRGGSDAPARVWSVGARVPCSAASAVCRRPAAADSRQSRRDDGEQGLYSRAWNDLDYDWPRLVRANCFAGFVRARVVMCVRWQRTVADGGAGCASGEFF